MKCNNKGNFILVLKSFLSFVLPLQLSSVFSASLAITRGSRHLLSSMGEEHGA